MDMTLTTEIEARLRADTFGTYWHVPKRKEVAALLSELDRLRAEVKTARAQAFRDAADWHQTEVVRNNITALHWTAKKTSDGQAEQYALEYSGKCDAHRESEDHFRQLAAEAEKPKEG